MLRADVADAAAAISLLPLRYALARYARYPR